MSGRRILIRGESKPIALGGTTSWELPLGRTYHRIWLNCANLTLAEITGIRFYLNGQLAQEYKSGTILDNINQIDNMTGLGSGDLDSTLPLCINFDRVGVRTREMQEVTAIGTHRGQIEDANPITSFTMEIDVAAGATGATIQPYHEQSAASASGIVKQHVNRTFTPSGGGKYEVVDIPRRNILNRIIVQTGTVNTLEILADNFALFQEIPAGLNDYRIGNPGGPAYRKKLASHFIWDSAVNGFATDGLLMSDISDFQLRFDLDDGTALPTIIEYAGPVTR